MLMTAPPKLKKQKKSPRLTPVYSGKRSLKFWNQINKIKGKEGSLVYIAGCASSGRGISGAPAYR